MRTLQLMVLVADLYLSGLPRQCAKHLFSPAGGRGYTMVFRGWYTGDGSDAEIIDALAEQDRTTMVEEDVHIVNSVQRGLMSMAYEPGPQVIDPNYGANSERLLVSLNTWIRDALGN